MTAAPTTCRRCGRALRAASSLAAEGGPIGRTCARRDREEAAAAAAGITPATLARATEDIEDGALVDTGYRTRTGRPVYEVVSSAGDARYLATPASCTCRAGHAGRMCRHRAAVILATAA